MFYGGESNVPGAPGNLLAGLSFPIQGGSSIGKPLLPNFKELKGDKRDPSFPPEENIPRYLLQQASIPGSSNLPGAVGNMGGLANAQFFEGPQLGQATPHGSPQRMQPREYLDKNMPAYPPGYGPPLKQPQSQPPEPFNPIQLELPLAMRGLQVPPGFQAKYVS